MSRCLALLMALDLVQSRTVGQSQQESQRAPLEPAVEWQKQAISRVRGFADRALSFRDPAAKISTLISLADLLWEFDEGYARQLFQKAYDCLIDAKGTTSSDSRLSKRQEIVAAIARLWRSALPAMIR
jgi:hypothetical protein